MASKIQLVATNLPLVDTDLKRMITDLRRITFTMMRQMVCNRSHSTPDGGRFPRNYQPLGSGRLPKNSGWLPAFRKCIPIYT